MKKVLAILLALLTALSLTACGEQGEPGGETSDIIASSESEASSEPENTTPDFDTGWAGDGYVMPFPEPPFAYEVSHSDNKVTVRSTNGGADGDVSHSSILEYCEALKKAGFTLNLTEQEIGERYGRICYEFSAGDTGGNSVNLLDDGGGVVIWFTAASK